MFQHIEDKADPSGMTSAGLLSNFVSQSGCFIFSNNCVSQWPQAYPPSHPAGPEISKGNNRFLPLN